MGMIEILTRENAEGVAKIEKECFSSECWTKEQIFAEIGDETKFYAVYVVDGQPIGFGGYAQVLDEGNILNIAVKKEYRNRGIGSAIIDAMLANGRERGLSSFILEVRVSNTQARMLYEKKGFVYLGIRKKFYPDKEDACMYRLEL